MKAIKYETSLDLNCDEHKKMLSKDGMLSQVKAMEQNLQIKSSEQINDTLTKEELKTAAKMFPYLNSCPTSWLSFYKDLFQTQSATNIVLTIYRILRKNVSGYEINYQNNQKIFRKITSVFKLKYKEIQNMLPGQVRKQENNFTTKGKFEYYS